MLLQLDTVCQDLKKAIKKLDKLFRKVRVSVGTATCATWEVWACVIRSATCFHRVALHNLSKSLFPGGERILCMRTHMHTLHAQKKKGEDIEGYPDCFQFSRKINEGLRSVNVVVGTSIGHTHNMESVIALFKAAMNYRHDVFSAAQKQELEGWVRASRVLKVG